MVCHYCIDKYATKQPADNGKLRVFEEAMPLFPHRDTRLSVDYSLVSDQLYNGDVHSGDEVENEKTYARWVWNPTGWHKISSIFRAAHSRLSFALPFVSSFAKHLSILLPSFVLSLYRRLLGRTPPTPVRSRPLGSTAYLDGLRGVAALVVYIFHFNYLWFPNLGRAYGSSQNDFLFWQLPIVRVLHSGRSSVTIFFIISGYVLTLKTLTAIHKGQGDRVLGSLAGSLFRRPFRLYLPIIASTAIAAVLIRFDNIFIPNIGGGDIPPRAATWTEQFWHWLATTEKTVSPFRPVTGREGLWGNDYNGHLWTIPTEFKGSLQVFLLLLAFSRSKRWVHLLGVSIAGYWQLVKGDYDQTLFCVGLLLAELSLVLPPSSLLSDSSLSLPSSSTVLKTVRAYLSNATTLWHVGTLALFAASVHLMSYPQAGGPSSPGFRTISTLVPSFYRGNEDRIQQFWISTGSIAFVLALMYSPPLQRWPRWGVRRPLGSGSAAREDEAAIPQSEIELAQSACSDGSVGNSSSGQHHSEPLLQRLFTSAFAQYLGRISYSLYLWHGAVNHIVGQRHLHPAAAALQAGEAGAAGLAAAGLVDDAAAVRAAAHAAFAWRWAAAAAANTLALFWASDLFHRVVDVPAVRLTRAISAWALAGR